MPRMKNSPHPSSSALPILFSTLLALLAPIGSTAASEGGDVAALIESFLLQQHPEHAERTKVTVNPPNLEKLPPCNQYQPFLPRGGKSIGKINVGLRCLGPASWSLFVSAQVAISGTYLSTAHPLAAGQVLTPQDFVLKQGDLAQLPAGTLVDPAQATGNTLKNALPAGAPLRRDQLQLPRVIQAGQNVRVVYRAPGFSASAEGKAIGNASAGQVTQVRMPSGQVISGTASPQGEVEIAR